jgi:hypothetical protein
MRSLLNPQRCLFIVLALWTGVVMPEANAQGKHKLEKQVEHEYKIKLESRKQKVKACNAELSISYQQYDTQAKVETNIENEDCAASGGKYTVDILVSDAGGQTHEIEHDETWSRDDNKPYASQKIYDIGKNVDLIRVRTTGLSCTCIP